MSCPYLEKGKTAYCHAFEDKRLAVKSSEIEGKGSVFSIFIPLKTEPLPDRGIKMAC